MKYIIDHIFSILAAIPLVLVTVGVFIINQYLSVYNVVEFPLFDPKTIYVGFFSLFHLFTFIVNWYVFLSIREEKFGFVTILINALIKPLFFCQLLWLIIIGSDYADTLTIFNKSIDLKLIFPFLFFIIMHYSFCVTFRRDIIKGKPYSKTYLLSRVLDTGTTIFCTLISILLILGEYYGS